MEVKYIGLMLAAFALSSTPANTNAEFDYFLFVEEWPQTLCEIGAIAHKPCKIPTNCTGWAIHGIWPTKLGIEGPNYCNKSAYFDWRAIDGLTGELMQFWPNCYVTTPFWSFWEHEYMKHGTCCVGIESMETEYDFFSTTLNLFQKHQIDSVLEAGGIRPSNSTPYRVSDITDKIYTATGVKPLLFCYYDSSTRVQLLQQIALCMDKSFLLINCPDPRSNCDENEPILYPQKPS